MKNKLISIACIFVIVLSVFMPFAMAASTSELASDVLLKVNGNTIKKTTKIEDLKKMFGNPILETASPFGGKMYTFYNESKDYNVYAETNSSGVLKVVGAISENFKSHNYESLKSGASGNASYNYSEDSVEKTKNGKYINIGVYVNNYTWQEGET